MIIETLLNLIYNVFSVLTLPINIPSLPEEIHSFIQTALEYISTGVSLLANYTHIEYLLIMFGLILAVDIGIGVYHLVMWIIKKIPFLGME